MKLRQLAGRQIPEIGLGCMTFSHGYSAPPSREHSRSVLLASKCGMTTPEGKRVIDSRPDSLKRTCEESLRRLRAEVIDLYYLHRRDKQVPIDARNLKLLDELDELAREAGCSKPQLALAWLLRKGPHVIPVVGTTSIAHLTDDVGAVRVELSDDLMSGA